jgi:oligopeptide/dipeptide ABC transporter ATP-binding protein
VADAPLLHVEGLATWFETEGGVYKAVDGVDFDVAAGKTLGIVGESGCGKSVTSLSIMGLVPEPPGIRAGGRILLDGDDLATLSADEMRRVRGDRLAMIFQEPMTSLNPVYRVGDQIVEGLVRSGRMERAAARERAIELLRLVRIPAPESRVDAYPHQLSGGMRQRVMIAMALAGDPELLIADEPTTALDVTIQAQILDLLRDLQARLGTAIILITHDLGVIAEMADEVVVMYAGKVVERAPVQALFTDAQHPYTLGLLDSVPKLDDTRDRLATIEGQVPHPGAEIRGCRFADRCVFASARCREAEPPLEEVATGHRVACWHAPLDSTLGEVA